MQRRAGRFRQRIIGQHIRGLVRDPVSGQPAYHLGERLPPGRRHLVHHGGVEYHQRRAGRRLRGQRRQVVHQVAAHEQRRVGRGDGGRGPQPGATVRMFRPDESFQLRNVRGVGHVERIQIQARPPHHLGYTRRRRHPGGRALEDRFARADHVVAVAVGVPVGVQA